MSVTEEVTTLQGLGLAAEQLKHWTRTRDEIIHLAYSAGVPVPKIAAAAGISRGRVYQVLRKTA